LSGNESFHRQHTFQMVPAENFFFHIFPDILDLAPGRPE